MSDHYLQLAQNQQLPEHKRYEYLVAAKLNMLMWEDAKDKVCAKFDIPETRDYGIDLISPDFTKVAQVKCFSTTKIGWVNIATFLSYNSAFIKAHPILVTTPDTQISNMVRRAIPEIVYISKTGIVQDVDYYVDRISKLVKTLTIEQAKSIDKVVHEMNQKPNETGHQLKYKKTKEFDSMIAKWVSTDPPVDLTKAEYFQKFLDARVCKISMNQLSNVMFGIGYETDRSHQPPKWKIDITSTR